MPPDCQALCHNSSTGCYSFTWHDKSTGTACVWNSPDVSVIVLAGSFYKKCIANDLPGWDDHPQAGHFSGLCTPNTERDFSRDNQVWFPTNDLPASLPGRQTGVALVSQVEPASKLYVDYDHGSDTGDGSEAHPFKTIAHAVQTSTSKPSPCSILLRAGKTILLLPLIGLGTHYLADTIDLTSANNGLTIQGYEEGVFVSGGVMLQPKWQAAGTSLGGPVFKATVPDIKFMELFNGTNQRLVGF